MGMDKIELAFNQIALEYDKQRESLIPCYHEFYGTIVKLAESELPQPRILDIGAGTGLLTNFLLQKYPNAKYTLIDISEEMLSIARKRFSNQINIDFIVADYKNYGFTEKYDIVASSLSIHHLGNDDKKSLYAIIFNLLNKNGIFINGDQFLARTPEVEKLIHKEWIKAIEKSPLKEEGKQAAYNRMKLDQPATVEDNLMWLEEAGFTDNELYYKFFNFGVIRGRKN
jgi:tRNA (cmo5U34)-methyltransferase